MSSRPLDCCMQFGTNSDNCEGTLLLKLRCAYPLVLEDVLAEKFYELGSPKITFKINNIPHLEACRQKLLSKQPGFTFCAKVKLDKLFPQKVRSRQQQTSSFWEGYMTSDIVEIKPDTLELIAENYAKANSLEYEGEVHMSLMDRFNERSQESRNMLFTNPEMMAATTDDSDLQRVYEQLLAEQTARKKLEAQVSELNSEVKDLSSEVRDLRQIIDKRFESVREAWRLAGN